MHDASPQCLSDFSLTPVIEIEPFPFRSAERESPAVSKTEDAAAWAAYWCDSLADSQIIGVTPIAEGPWDVATRFFGNTNQELLTKVLAGMWRYHTADRSELMSREAGVLSSGVVLKDSSDSIRLDPSCCGDLGVIDEWSSILASKPSEWTMLWVGHPWVHVRCEGDLFIVSARHEGNAPPPSSAFAIHCEQLDAQLADARVELKRFADLVEKTLFTFGCTGDLRNAAQHLCGMPEDAAIC